MDEQREEGAAVVFKMDEREKALPIDDAKHILGYRFADARKLSSRSLYKKINEATEAGGGEARLSELERLELLSVLDGIDEQGLLTDGQRALREAAYKPILGLEP